MIWLNLALFFVSFLLTALLAPKPEIEDARPAGLDQFDFPRVTESAPIPLLLGRAIQRAPNTIWYGDYLAAPITKKVKTGLFSSKRVAVGFRYYLTVDMALCLGPADLKEIFVDDEPVASGEGGEIEFDPLAFKDEEVPINTTSTFDPLTFGYSEDDIDQGRVNISASLSLFLQFTGLGGSGPAPGVLTMDIEFFTDATETVELGGPNFPINVGASETGNISVSTGDTLPAGCRHIKITTNLVLTFPLFSFANLNSRERCITGVVAQDDRFTADIFEPELFGGDEKGGGWIGNYAFYRGGFIQQPDEYLSQAVQKERAGTLITSNHPQPVPGYRGTCRIVYYNNFIGESPRVSKTAYDLCSYTDHLGLSDNKVNTDDLNPMEAVYEILVNKWRGLGVDPAKVNAANFAVAGETLLTEGNGVSLLVSAQSSGANVLQEILRQIDGFLYQDPETGLFEIRLIRDDYVVASLPSFDEDNVKEVRTITGTTFAEVVAQVKVSFSSREKTSQIVASQQDMAVANTIGFLRTTTVNFPFCYDPTLAANLAARELSQLSVPIKRITLEMNREAFQLRPGDVFRFSWQRYGLVDFVLRCQKVKGGELLDGKIVLECVQDVFALRTLTFAPPTGTGWVETVPDPENVDVADVVEMPNFLARAVDNPPNDGDALIIPFPVAPSAQSELFTLVAGDTISSVDVVDPEDIEYPETATLAVAYSLLEGFDTGTDTTTGLVIENATSVFPTFALADNTEGTGGIIYVNGEWMAYETVTDNLDGTYTLGNVKRGLFGTTWLSHDVGDRIFLLEQQFLGTGVLGDDLQDTETVFYKLLDTAGGVTQGASGVTAESLAMNQLANRPLRPRNLLIDASRAPDQIISPTGAFTVSWLENNRLAAAVALENDAGEMPDQPETYELRVYFDGVEEVLLAQTGIAGLSAVVDLSVLATAPNAAGGEVRVTSTRTSDSLGSFYYSVIPFALDNDILLLAGDQQTAGNDGLLLSGDQQTGTDKLKVIP